MMYQKDGHPRKSDVVEDGGYLQTNLPLWGRDAQ
jgi:hypothetical protein